MSDQVIAFSVAMPSKPSLPVRLWRSFCRAMIVRRNLQILAQMDDRALSDIGASRSYAVWQSSRPVWDRHVHRDPA